MNRPSDTQFPSSLSYFSPYDEVMSAPARILPVEADDTDRLTQGILWGGLSYSVWLIVKDKPALWIGAVLLALALIVGLAVLVMLGTTALP